MAKTGALECGGAGARSKFEYQGQKQHKVREAAARILQANSKLNLVIRFGSAGTELGLL